MDTRLEIIIPGNPSAQKRHRHRRNGHTWDPSKKDKKKVQQELLQVKPTEPIKGPVRVEIDLFIQTPESWSKVKQERHEGQYRPKKPDADNYSKLLLDAMNGMIYEDDNQVVDLQVKKFYSMKPCTVIGIEEISDE